jgi:hypothetical protein
MTRRRLPWLVFVGTVVTLFAEPALAHAGSLSGTYRSAAVPSWLVVLTGAGVIGASFLFTSLFTDHETIRDVNGRHLFVPSVATVRRAAVWLARGIGVVGLVVIVLSGLFGPTEGNGNLAVLAVWAGWWAGYTMTAYLVVDSWDLFNPWRTLSTALARLRPEDALQSYPDRLGAWPAVVGLLGLVYVEVVTPVAEGPRLLTGLVLGYTLVTLAGALAVGVDTWFGKVDPIAGVFRYYGRMAPIQRTADGLQFRFPGAGLTEADEPEDAAGTAFVVALLWVTTFDGLVTTPAWATVAGPVVDAGVPGLLLYLVAMLSGFVVFLGGYRVVSGWARRTADSYVTARFVEGWFVPSLIPIAAGYHVAHFLGFFLSLSPALHAVVDQPFTAPATIPVGVLPGWFGAVQLAFVVLGHLLAVWVAHALSFRVFTGRLQPIRSQYPFILVMIAYTAISMWIVSQPFTTPPGLGL